MNTITRRGFSLVEVVVVIAIVGVLIALLVPAVQKVRESSSRTQCAANLKQIGLAVHHYHNTYKALPPTCIRQDWATWAVLILPYVEKQGMYKLWDTQLRYYDQPNRGTTSDPTPHNVPTYFCPSRRPADVGFSVATGDTVTTADIPTLLAAYGGKVTHRPGGLGDYAASFGNVERLDGNGALTTAKAVAALKPGGIAATPDDLTKMFAQPPGTKITDWKSRTTIASITDGTGNTLLIGEKYVLPENRWGKNEDRSIFNGGWARAHRRFAGVAPGGGGHFPLVADINDTWDGRTPLMAEASQRFGSHHPGVCQFVFCDATVRPVRSDIDEKVLGRLAARADGEAIPDGY